MKPWETQQRDRLLITGLRRSHINVTHEGKLKIEFEESIDYAVQTLRKYIEAEKEEHS